MSAELNLLYHTYESPAGLSRPSVLYQEAKKAGHDVTHKQVQDYLATQDAHTLHRQVIRKFPRNRIMAARKDSIWQMDLADMQSLARYNDGFRYIFVLVDVLSKYLFALPLRDKTGETVASALKQVFTSRCPEALSSDKGTEFLNVHVQKVLREHSIKFFTTQNEDIKSAIAERVIRTLKGKLYKYFTARNTYRYIDILPKIVQSYNNTIHRSIKMTPASVTRANEKQVWNTLYLQPKVKPYKKKFTMGDTVRIAKAPHTFRRGYHENWSHELFKVDDIIPRSPHPVYILKDLHDERIQGTFYPKELELVKIPEDTLYKIEKILKTRKIGNKLQYLVKFMGYDDSFNDWVDSLDHV